MSSVNTRNSNYQRRWDFNGSALPSEWSLVALGSGMTVSVSGGALQIAAGTTADAETILACNRGVTVKFVARFIAMLSQRIANQTFYLEAVNAARTTFARWILDGTSATSAKVEGGNAGVTKTAAAAVTIPTTANNDVFEIHCDLEQTLFSCANSNANAVKSGLAVLDGDIPEPGEEYFLQIRVVNGSTAPASSTTLSVDAITLEDVETLVVEIGRATGDGHAAVALPVRPVGGTLDTVSTVTACSTVTTAYTAPKTVRYTDSTASLAANATYTGTGRDMGTTNLYEKARTFVSANQPGTLYFEQSSDNSNWYVVAAVAVAANTPRVDEHLIAMRYCRVRYVNGATANTAFKLDSIYMG